MRILLLLALLAALLAALFSSLSKQAYRLEPTHTEYVIIRYPNDRKVNIDGKEAGGTNQTLMVSPGHHIFDLGEPFDYKPPKINAQVKNTTSITPLIIHKFQPKEKTP